MTYKKAIEHINNHGALLIFPIKNKPEFPSLWSCFYPRTKMRWEWDECGDDRVVKLWHLKTKLGESGEVVYSKWFRDRATVFSKDVFTHMLAAGQVLQQQDSLLKEQESKNIYEILLSDSPQSTKQLKKITGLQGKMMNSLFNRALRELFRKNMIVGYGEVEDGSFPSLAIGTTSLLFEDLWLKSSSIESEKAWSWLNKNLAPENPYLKYFQKLQS